MGKVSVQISPKGRPGNPPRPRAPICA
ncbi:conserved hypothetical protein [Theileria orientalis strain Shintoku]|uniref:Uncharacterized protein n=1 Tax=Theileria orientalis strain Shintoku TaxID=869250 RepID=J4CC81_THEOR|nr:conserved hypothetical protein [Theileria orientalis strain Shintoku]BAM38932.1 conserved hypothetical protein [Theileria orientalis strain Shintoku]|eukprot:XP_009689233.1 conserved hypothetical protein [Theileria orientalis strain Shintoku]